MYNFSSVLGFLQRVDACFPTPLSQKQDLATYARKLCEKATVCVELAEGEIVAMVAGYTDNLVDDKAYISIVATLPEAQGKGIASRLVESFIHRAAEKGVSAVHLYAVPSNIPAMRMYEKLGFVPFAVDGELRPGDAHLIYYIKKEQ